MYLHTTLAAVFVAVSMQVIQPLNRFCHGGGAIFYTFLYCYHIIQLYTHVIALMYCIVLDHNKRTLSRKVILQTIKCLIMRFSYSSTSFITNLIRTLPFRLYTSAAKRNCTLLIYFDYFTKCCNPASLESHLHIVDHCKYMDSLTEEHTGH